MRIKNFAILSPLIPTLPIFPESDIICEIVEITNKKCRIVNLVKQGGWLGGWLSGLFVRWLGE